MGGPESLKISITASTPGADSNTYNLLNTSTWTGGAGILRAINASRLKFALANNAAGTLKFYHSVDKGTNWDQVGGSISVPASGATDISGPYDFLIDPYSDVKLDWVNGGSAQTTWRPMLTMEINQRASGT